MEEPDQVAGLFFDLTKTFDWRKIEFVENKWYNMGLRGMFFNRVINKCIVLFAVDTSMVVSARSPADLVSLVKNVFAI